MENMYRQLFEAMEEGFISAEIIRGNNGAIIDWRYLEVNNAIQKNTGFHSCDIIGRLGSEIFPAETERWLHIVNHVLKTQHSSNIQQYFQSVDRWFESIVFPFGPDRFGVLYRDITDQRRRESNAAMLGCVTNELAGLCRPEDIMYSVGALVGDYLQVSSCSFVDVDEDLKEVTIQYNWQMDGMPSLKQTFRLADFLSEEYIRSSRAGQTVAICDTGNDERADAVAYKGLNIGALVTVPFIWQGRWIASTCITSAEPRIWKEDEIELLQEISNRLFSRVERARAEQALRRSEQNYRTLFESVDEGVCILEVIFDEDGQPVDLLYLDANPTFEKHTGFYPVGKRIKDFHPDIEQSWIQYYADVVKTRKPIRREAFAKSLGRWFSVAAAPVGDSGNIAAAVFDDITARKVSEKFLRDNEQIQTFLLRLSDELRPLTDPSQIQEIVTHISMDFFHADRCYYSEVIDGRKIVRRDAAREGLSSIIGSYTLQARLRTALETGNPVIVENVDDNEVIDPWVRALCEKFEIGSFICIPVSKKGELRGTLCITQCEPRKWTDLEVGLAVDVAFRTWVAIERAKAEQQLERELLDMRRLQQVSNQLIEKDNIQPLYEAILDSAMEIMNADGANIQCFIPEKNELFLLAHKNFHPESARHWQHIKRDLRSAYWTALLSRGRVIISNIEESQFPVSEEDLYYCRLSKIGSVQNTPLISRAGNHVGMLSTHWSQPHEPSDRDCSLLDVLARQTADLIEQRHSEEALLEARRQLASLGATGAI